MTEHARLRLAERIPGCDPGAALAQIRAHIDSGRASRICTTITGDTIWETRLLGRPTFPVVAPDGAIKTILSPGMVVETPTGPATLKPTVLEPGLHSLEADRYHADPAPEPSLSSTIARLLLRRSPAHAWHASPRLNPDWQPVEKAHFDIGRAAHRALLGAGADYAVIPDELLDARGAASTKAAKAWIEEARQDGLTPIKADVATQIETMATICRVRLRDAGLELEPERSELAALAQIDGTWCRCMADNAPERALGRLGPLLVDFKTTTDANPAAIERAVMTYGYDLQAAHYVDTWRAATGETRAFVFVFQEKEPPHEVAIALLAGEALEIGQRQAREARQLWRACVESGDWPGYEGGIHQIRLPDFYTARWLESESQLHAARDRISRGALEAAHRWQAPDLHDHDPMAGAPA